MLAIGQASHAWISGQLARAWGNADFGAIEPHAEVCLAAEQHDVGMAEWDLAPTRNPETGLPHSFMEMPLPVHLGLWSAAPRRLARQSRYASLLVSMHGMRLYQRRDLTQLPRDEADAVRRYVSDQRQYQEELIASFAEDPSVDRQLVARNSQLIWIWDYLSLAICLDWAPTIAHKVPTAAGAVEMELNPAKRPKQLTLEPWPFHSQAVTVRCEGQRLRGAYESDAALHAAFASAEWETVEFKLVH